MKLSSKKMLGRPAEFAMNSAHGVAFHRGLGNPLHPSSSTPMSTYLDENRLAEYSRAAYAKSNFAIVANGVAHQELSKWVGEFFTELEQSPGETFKSAGATPTKYYGGEERIAHDSGNTMVIAFPGSGSVTGNSYKPEAQVLAALLGGQSNIKWAPGFSLLSRATEAYPQAHIATTHHTYSDAGLLTISISGNARQVRGASEEVVKTLKSVASGKVSKEDVKKAVATAKFKALESGQNISTGIELTGAGLVNGGKPFQIDELGKTIDSVTEDQIKKVSAPTTTQYLRANLHSVAGCKIVNGRKGNRLDRGRLVHTSFRRRNRPTRVGDLVEHFELCIISYQHIAKSDRQNPAHFKQRLQFAEV